MSAQKPTLREQLDQLEQIVTWFEQEDLDVEEAIAKFDDGAKLADDIKTRLGELENKITILKQRFDSE